MTAKQKVVLGDNLHGELEVGDQTAAAQLRTLEAQNAELLERIEALTREANTPLVNMPKPNQRPLFARVRIILEENEGIAPSGQYFGLHGNWVNPETLLALEPLVASKEITRKEAQERATEKVQFEAYLRPGEKADVPVELLTVLNDAITSVPQIDPSTSQVLGYKDKLRYPYRILPAGE